MHLVFMSLLFILEHSSVLSHLFVTDIFKECRPQLLEMSLNLGLSDIFLVGFWGPFGSSSTGEAVSSVHHTRGS